MLQLGELWQQRVLRAGNAASHKPSGHDRIRGMTTHKCDCGTKYKVAVTKTLADRVICEKCGTLMDRQSNKSVLAYERIPGDE
jgi:hypothetical protein